VAIRVSVFEFADYIAFVLAALGGVAVGRRMRPRPPTPLKPICTCGHGYGTHEHGRACGALVEDYYRDVMDPCPCTRYDGPDPAIFGLPPVDGHTDG